MGKGKYVPQKGDRTAKNHSTRVSGDLKEKNGETVVS